MAYRGKNKLKTITAGQEMVHRRLMSRSAAKQSFSVEGFREQMEGIYTTSVGQAILDECPMAYKDNSLRLT